MRRCRSVAVVTIVMSCGKSFNVSAEDWHGTKTIALPDGESFSIRPSRIRWGLSAHSGRSQGYATNRFDLPGGRRITLLLHRLVMECPRELFVNHIDGNTLNNCRENLEVVTPRQNAIWRRGRRDILRSLGFSKASEIPESFECVGMFSRNP